MFDYKAWLSKDGKKVYDFNPFSTHEEYLAENPELFKKEYKRAEEAPDYMDQEDEYEEWIMNFYDAVMNAGWIRVTTDSFGRTTGLLYHTYKLDTRTKNTIYDHAKEIHEEYPGVRFLLYVETPRKEYRSMSYEDFIPVLFESRKIFSVILESTKELDLEDRINEFCQSIRDRYPVTEFEMYLDTRSGTLVLDRIVVDKIERKKGIGSKIMEEVIKFADKERKVLQLQVADKATGWGTTSKGRLYTFYRKFGFVKNFGRNKRYSLSLYANMYRDPR